MKTAQQKARGRSRTRWARLRKMLVARSEELLEQMRGELASSRGVHSGGRSDDVCDRATDNLYNEMAQEFAEIATADLRMIGQAIQRIDEGSYGCCEICGRPISEARLKALPFAELCIECKRQEEADGSRGGDRHRPAYSAQR